MPSASARFIAAVVQASPVVFDREATLARVRALAGEAARKGARLVLFPEAFVSAYPRGLDFGAVVGARTESGRDDFRRYWDSSVEVPGPAVESLAETARLHAIYLGDRRRRARRRHALLHRCCSSGPTARTSASTGR
jgi:nitrilase